MYHILYISFAPQHQSAQALVDILQVAQKNNSACGVTGLLLYDDQVFLQLLEGQTEDVTRIYNKILKDPRHAQVTVLSEGEYDGARLFPEWKMGFYHMKFLDKLNIEGLASKDIDDIRCMLAQQTHLPQAVVLNTFIRANMHQPEAA